MCVCVWRVCVYVRACPHITCPYVCLDVCMCGMCAGACVNAFVNCRKFRSRHPRTCADEFEINVSECVIKAGPKAPSPRVLPYSAGLHTKQMKIQRRSRNESAFGNNRAKVEA